MKLYLVYGITDCPACLKTQAELMDRGMEYVFINSDFSKSYRDAIREEFGWPTFPIIIEVSEKQESLIGGYDELMASISPVDPSPT